ncbi:hypothetical protein ACE10X_27240 [Bradyrhizobium sp. Pha-3]|uniref:hypothetical protein n=1 Tax=Bradyrhizobium sp. Pha-3 TaxID=208375 RepID=UPI0035D3FDD7
MELVQQSWTARQPYLLAPLGIALRKEFPNDYYTELGSRKFKAYVQAELAGDVHLIQNPSKPIEWGLVPATVDPSTVRFGERRASSEGASSVAPAPHTLVRYASELWNAFSSPIEVGFVRIIKLGEVIHVQDIAENVNPPNGHRVISRDDAAKSSDPSDRSYPVVSGKIEDWARKNNIDLAPYKTTRVRLPTQRSVLDAFLDSIPVGDLSSISLPMHIVKALNDKKI